MIWWTIWSLKPSLRQNLGIITPTNLWKTYSPRHWIASRLSKRRWTKCIQPEKVPPITIVEINTWALAAKGKGGSEV